MQPSGIARRILHALDGISILQYIVSENTESAITDKHDTINEVRLNSWTKPIKVTLRCYIPTIERSY